MLYIVAIGWMFVVVLMSVVEATAPNGSVLGAIFTFLLYGVIPLGLVLYLLGTPLRARQRQAKESDTE
jgi:mannose/fructose/N-acetylgalactosamine-specific phosphotransferase system component IID